MSTAMIGRDDELLAIPHASKKSQDTVSILTAYLFLLMAVPSDMVFAPLGGAGAPSNILGVLFFVVYLFKLLNPAVKFGRTRLALRTAAVFLLCAFLASYIAANLRVMPTLERNGADRGLIMLSGWLGVLLLTADGVSSLERLKKLLDRIAFGGTALAALGIIQFATGINPAQYISIPGLATHPIYSDTASRGGYNRPQATTSTPLELSFILAAVLPIAIHRVYYSPKEKRRVRWAQMGLIGLSLPLSVSRSGMISIIVILVVILPIWSRRERLAALGTVLAAFAVVEAAVPGLLHKISNLFFAIGSDASTSSRTSALSGAMPIIAKHPIFGQGFGTFLPSVYFFTDDQYLSAAIELGVVGMLALLTFYATGWVTARRVRRLSTDGEIRHLAQCLAASCAVIMTVSATFDILYFAMASGVIFIILGCVGALYRFTSTEEAAELAQSSQ